MSVSNDGAIDGEDGVDMESPGGAIQAGFASLEERHMLIVLCPGKVPTGGRLACAYATFSGVISRSILLRMRRSVIRRSYRDCRLSQNSALVPKYRARRSAVSAGVPRRPPPTSSCPVGPTAPTPSTSV